MAHSDKLILSNKCPFVPHHLSMGLLPLQHRPSKCTVISALCKQWSVTHFGRPTQRDNLFNILLICDYFYPQSRTGYILPGKQFGSAVSHVL